VVEDQTLDVISIGMENVTTLASYGELVQRLDRLTKKKSQKKPRRHTLRLANSFITCFCHFYISILSLARPIIVVNELSRTIGSEQLSLAGTRLTALQSPRILLQAEEWEQSWRERKLEDLVIICET
jgi:hypothetical protein